MELIGIETEIKLAIQKLSEWAAPRPVEKNLITISDEVYIHPEPLGVVLIIGAWNYPWAVTLLPLIGAIAAGKGALQILHLTVIHLFTQVELLAGIFRVFEGRFVPTMCHCNLKIKLKVVLIQLFNWLPLTSQKKKRLLVNA